MKTCGVILFFVTIVEIVQAQDTLRSFEFGSTLLTVNSFNANIYEIPDRPSVEILNGLFFRCTKKRWGLRINASYSDNTTPYETPPGSPEGINGQMHNKDFRVGLGAQYSLLKHKQWLYTFADISYRNVFSTGTYNNAFSGIMQNISSTSNGFDCFVGFGLKLKLIRNLYLSPEFGIYSSSKFVNRTTTTNLLGQPLKFEYFETNINPALKLHFTVMF